MRPPRSRMRPRKWIGCRRTSSSYRRSATRRTRKKPRPSVIAARRRRPSRLRRPPASANRATRPPHRIPRARHNLRRPNSQSDPREVEPMPASSKFSHRVADENLTPEEIEARRREAEVRGELIAPKTRRHAWLNIAGPLGAVLIAIMLAAFYKNPIGVLRFVQSTQLGWSGVQKSEIGLDAGLMTYYINSGYPDMEPVIMIHGLGPNAALVWRDVMGPVGQGHYKVMAPNL